MLVVVPDVHPVSPWHGGGHLERARAVQVVKETMGDHATSGICARDFQLTWKRNECQWFEPSFCPSLTEMIVL